MSGIPSWARKGALVICVDDQPPKRIFEPFRLRARHIYTVDGPGDYHLADGTDGIKIVGHPNRALVGGSISSLDCGWSVPRFRPLVENASETEAETVLYRKRKDKLHQRVSTKSRERA